MSSFRVELKKIVDDSYDVQIGQNLIPVLVRDIRDGLAGNIKKFAVITDTEVEKRYAVPILEELKKAGYDGDIFSFPAG